MAQFPGTVPQKKGLPSCIWSVGLILFLLLGSCSTAWRTVRYNAPSINDHKIFEARPIRSPGFTTPLHKTSEPELPPLSAWALGKHYQEGQTPEEFFRKTGTVAFIVLKNDTIQYEWYAPKKDQESVFTTFSMAKVYVSTLIGIAIEEGYIHSVDDPIGNYLSYCTDSAFCNLTIRNLLQMTSGLKTHESILNPFGTTPRLYYTRDLSRVTQKLKMGQNPGEKFEYKNLNTQLLSEVLTQATGKSLAAYMEEKIWQPMGAEADASWSLDQENGTEKAFCCLNARARDFARFGLFMAHLGEWNGTRIVSTRWLREATAADTARGSRQHYQYHWYTTAEQEDFYAEGLLGQFTYICPSQKKVIIRLGKKVHIEQQWYNMFKILAGLEDKPQPIELPRETLRKYAGTYTFGVSNLGDSSMYGRKVHLRAKGNGLLVTSSFNKRFVITPESREKFFFLPAGRKMEFQLNDEGVPEKIRWRRRGNSWWVTRDPG